MEVVKKLGDRVEREHGQFLRDSQRLEDRSAIPASGVAPNPVVGEVNFENLVGSGDGATVKQDTAIDGSSKGWDEDDVWGSIFSSNENVGIDLFGSVHVNLSLSDLLGHHANSGSSTSYPNSIAATNSDDFTQFDYTTNNLKLKPKRFGCPTNLIQFFQSVSFQPHEHSPVELLDPVVTATPLKPLALDLYKYQQLLDAELYDPTAVTIG